MRILQVHNRYAFLGGEDTVVEEERALLEDHKHEVVQYLRSNEEINQGGLISKVGVALSLRHSRKTEQELKEIIERFRPDICHVHNIFMLVTPAVYEICSRYQIPVVQSLHNYKLLCTNGLLFRENEICEKCIGKSLYPSVPLKCFKHSFIETALVADVIMHHRRKQTWSAGVALYSCLTEFARQKFIEGGLPPDKLVVRPNFIKMPDFPAMKGDYFLFVGRLEVAKGVTDIFELAKDLPEVKIRLIGSVTGDIEPPKLENLRLMGAMPREEVIKEIANCKALILPSRSYEGMPMTILEAFSLQKPVIVRNVGGLSTMVNHQKNGLHFSTYEELEQGVQALNSDSLLCDFLGKNAFSDYRSLYSPEVAYGKLIDLYDSIRNPEGRNH